MSTTSEQISLLAKPLATSLNLTLWGVEVLGGGLCTVRVYVEGEEGVSIDQCAELSRMLGLTLEVEDIIENAYVLEVSSPGLERIFFTEEQLAGALNARVDVMLYSACSEIPGRRRFVGTLVAVNAGVVQVALDAADSLTGEATVVSLLFPAIKKVKQVFVPVSVKKTAKIVTEKQPDKAGKEDVLKNKLAKKSVKKPESQEDVSGEAEENFDNE